MAVIVTTVVKATFENGLIIRGKYALDGEQALSVFQHATEHLGPIRAGTLKAKTDWLITLEMAAAPTNEADRSICDQCGETFDPADSGAFQFAHFCSRECEGNHQQG
jgi:hypothetical protein